MENLCRLSSRVIGASAIILLSMTLILGLSREMRADALFLPPGDCTLRRVSGLPR